MARVSVRALMFLALALLLGGPRMAHAAESYDNCTGFITSIPTVINTQGTWCLKQDLATSMTGGAAITISTNNVTIDCNNFKLGGLAAGISTAAVGIYALNKSNATVRHCNIRGFSYGIFLDSTTTGGHLIEDNRLDGNTFVAIHVDGDGSTIRRNRLFDTGQTPLSANIYGIVTHYNVDVIDNTVSGVTARSGSGGYVVGIETYLNTGNSVSGNRVNGLLGDGVGASYAIYNFSLSRVAMRDNDLFGSAAANSSGIICQNGNGSAKNNVIDGFVTAITTCSDDGGNSVHP